MDRHLPESVRLAKERGDVAALRRLGRIGAAVAQRNRLARKKMAAQTEAKRLAAVLKDWAQTARASNEHILSIDPDDEPVDLGEE